MINVKEETVKTAFGTTDKTQEQTNTLDFKKSTTATVLNLWVKSFNKWMLILNNWKKEADLIDRLIATSILGEEQGYYQLHLLHHKLNVLIESEIKHLEKEILDMRENLDLLQRYVINTDTKMRDVKIRMQQCSEKYSDLKLKIFHELTKVYPVSII